MGNGISMVKVKGYLISCFRLANPFFNRFLLLFAACEEHACKQNNYQNRQNSLCFHVNFYIQHRYNVSTIRNITGVQFFSAMGGVPNPRVIKKCRVVIYGNPTFCNGRYDVYFTIFISFIRFVAPAYTSMVKST